MKLTRKNLPSISITIPTFNEEKNIKKCLISIFRQYYPKKLLEIIIIDNYSTDKTIEFCKSFNTKIIFNDIKDAEVSKILGLKNSKNDLFIYIDADIELIGKNWLLSLIRPFIHENKLVGAFGRFYPFSNDYPIGRYLRYHPLELDPVFQFFCTSIKRTIIKQKEEYALCEFIYPRIPPIGICIYNKRYLLKVLENLKKFMDVDVPCLLSLSGYTKFAYVESAKFYHINVKNLSDVLKKRWRNLNDIFLANEDIRIYKYFDLKSFKGLFKIFYWIIYANLLFPEFIMGIYKSTKFKDIACLYQPILSFCLTDIICFGFIKKFFKGILCQKK